MKRKRIVIFATTIALAASGVSLKINREKSKEFKRYINTYAEDIIDDEFQISAHRGFSSLAVENTKESISLASSKNYVDYIEIDARLTSDKRIVLSHDNVLLLPSEEIRGISTMTYEEATNTTFKYSAFPLSDWLFSEPENTMIIDRNIGLNGQKYKVIGLLEGLKYCQPKSVLLDLKFNNDAEEFTEELKRELDGIDTSNLIIQSLDLPSLMYLKQHSNFNCLALISCQSDFAYLPYFDKVGIKYTLINYELIQNLINQGITIAVWTINNTESLKQVLNNVGEYYKDLIYITNYPDLIVTRLHEKINSLEYSLTKTNI